MKANLRRVVLSEPEDDADVIRLGDLELDLKSYVVRKNGKPLELTFREYELFKYLATQAGQVFTREKLLEEVWGYEYYGDISTVDVTVMSLGEKVEDDAANPTYIITKRGVGYYFKKQ